MTPAPDWTKEAIEEAATKLKDAMQGFGMLLYLFYFIFFSFREKVIIYGQGIGSKSWGDIENILRVRECASKYFSVKIFATSTVSFVNLQYPYELQSNV